MPNPNCETMPRGSWYIFFDIYEINGISPNQINLYELLPYSLHQLDMPLLFCRKYHEFKGKTTVGLKQKEIVTTQIWLLIPTEIYCLHYLFEHLSTLPYTRIQYKVTWCNWQVLRDQNKIFHPIYCCIVRLYLFIVFPNSEKITVNIFQNIFFDCIKLLSK